MKAAIIAPCPPPYGGIVRVIEINLALWPNDRIQAHFLPMYAPENPEPPALATFMDLNSPQRQQGLSQSLKYAAQFARILPVTRPSNAMHIFRYAAALEAYVKENDIDVIYAHELWPAGAVAHMVARTTGAASVVAAYGESFGVDPQHKRWRRASKWTVSHADFLVATSCHCITGAQLLSQRPSELSQIIYAGIDTEKFNPSVDGTNWRNRNNIDPSAFVVSVLGLVLKRKLDIFVQALRLMDSDTKIVAVIGGKGQDEQYFQDATKDLQNVNLLFVGFVPEEDLPEFYAASDVLVVSPRTELECMGQSMKEAMACSVATVGANIGGIPEAIEHGVNGLLYEADNPQDLAKSLNNLRADPNFRMQLAKAGRETAESKFSAVAAADSTLQVFERAIKVSKERAN
jgi:glycosyltransferase involved in cell wall biosynthesis